MRHLADDVEASRPLGAPRRTTRADEVADRIVRHVSTAGRPSVVAVRKDGEESCYGASTSDVKVELSTWFPIGSLTKVFTGSLLSAAAHSGIVGVHEPVKAFFTREALPVLWGGVSLDNLATHVSGLPESPGNLDGSPWDPYSGWDTAELIEAMRIVRIRRDKHYRYSNFGYAVLAECLCRRLGQPYREALGHYLGGPLDLPCPSVGPPEDLRVPGPLWSFGAMAGAGGLWSCLRDLLRWSATLADPGSRRRHPWIADAQDPRSETVKGDRYGYGWYLRRSGQFDYLYTVGAVSSSFTWMAIQPATGATTVGWTSARPVEAAQMTADVLTMFFAGTQ